MIRFGLLVLLCMTWEGILAQQEDCRLDLNNLKPLIERNNPFFSDHKWNSKSRIEMARIDNDRLLVITQDGCLRHHIRFGLLIDARAVRDEVDFWTEEAASMFHKVYFEQEAYYSFAEGFEKGFREKVDEFGVNQAFNFPVGGRTFICQVVNDPVRGARVTIEMVNFVFKESVQARRSGIPDEQDDGWQQKP
ncbi:MAG: hypothetical protein AAFQ68_21080 [Bacteroidota bacterium]